ncbi:MAG: ribonuclease III [Prevotella sp.]|nr:ribonuclease III [Prevotella sp.]MDE6011241.1 ribonuclease III [Prevotella sp.]
MRVNNFIDRIKLPFRKEKELFSSLYDIIGFYPHNISYYKMALTHKSSGQRNEKGKLLNNERLEFLGDAILDAVVGHIVYEHFKGKREGFLTNTRSKLVSRETLGKLAGEMGLTELIQSNGPQRSHNSYMAGNAFEALVGAIYLDQGYDAVMRFMKKRILAQMVNIDKVAYKEVNFKSKLLEWTQKNRVKMEFCCLKQSKDEKGSPIFGFQVMIEGVEGGKGQGFSKKEAQQECSKETLQRLRREPQFIDAIFAAKSNRTKMEEEPTAVAPDLEAEKEFIIKTEKPVTLNNQETSDNQEPSVDEFDLSGITHNRKELSREDIIAAAETAAYQEE